MNRSFRTPVVEAAAGGARGGGTRLTPLGEEVVRLYREVERRADAAAAAELRALLRLLR
jgi:molybdate transport system regulatory protein